ncbi:putative Replication-associated protein REP1 [Giardia muris]|nr:putative Replication-associated protein REP1 [Giardia muris]|eukprot:TNJ26108.1 putative Replication-associated protein REP1 [Giardia muris]
MVFRYHADPSDVLFGPLGVLRVILIWTCMLKPKHGLGVLDWRPGFTCVTPPPSWDAGLAMYGVTRLQAQFCCWGLWGRNWIGTRQLDDEGWDAEHWLLELVHPGKERYVVGDRTSISSSSYMQGRKGPAWMKMSIDEHVHWEATGDGKAQPPLLHK